MWGWRDGVRWLGESKDEGSSWTGRETSASTFAGASDEESRRTNATDLHAVAGEGAEGGLSTRAGGLGEGATTGANLDVEGGDTALEAAGGNVLGGKHSSVGGALVAGSLDHHTAGDLNEGLTAGEISDVNESVVEGGVDVGNAEHVLASDGVGEVGLSLLLLGGGLLLGGHRTLRIKV